MTHVLHPQFAATETALAAAADAWRQAIGDNGVLTDTAAYNTDTSSFSGQIPLALCPTSVAQVQDAVRIAQQFSIPIYPISTGHNWGYGTSVPVRSPAVVLDLSRMNRILAFDSELGVVTLEPGVTQRDLSAYLKARGLAFMVPVTGAGPSCSVLANALERGFGITPMVDHFGAVISLKAVLPNGEIFESYARAFDAAGAAQAYKWGTGPYLDGLFSQSGFGVVVDASIALRERPERCGVLFFALDADSSVEVVSEPIRRLLAASGDTIGAINVMNRSRIESLLTGAQILSARASRSHGPGPLPAGAWFGVGSIYGSKAHYRATCRLVRRFLGGQASGLRIYTANDIARLQRLSAVASCLGWRRSINLVERLQAMMEIVQGIPSTFALPLAYARSGRAECAGDLNPARDGCGLFWYAPIVPLRRGVAGQFITFVEQTCTKHGLPSPITLTAVSPRYYAATVPLLFDPMSAGAEDRAKACFAELYEQGLRLGFMPYRLGAQFMPAFARTGGRFGALATTIKHAIDPNLVLARGRYSFD